MKILVFDTETTGLQEKGASIYDKSRWPYIIQLSYILYDISNNSTFIKNNYIKLDNSIVFHKRVSIFITLVEIFWTVRV